MNTANYRTLQDLVLHAADRFPDTRFFLSEDAEFPHVTGVDLKHFCGAFGPWMEHFGPERFHVALLGRNCAAWLTCYFSVLSSGHVAVPLHADAAAEDLEYFLTKSDSDLLLYDRSCRNLALTLAGRIPDLQAVEMHDLLQELSGIREERFPRLSEESPAALYFTSGTTSLSRCVILSHRNLASHTNAAMDCLPLSPRDTGLSILPVSHTLETMTNIVGALHCGGTLYINDSMRNVKRNLRRYEPSVIVCVPLVLKTIQKEILRTAEKEGRLALMQKAMRINSSLQRVGLDLSRVLFREVYDVLGHNLRYFFCGGASLDRELILFYKALGVEVLQGYGITECSPIVSVNRPGDNRIGSIGRPMPCCEVKILDGEICVRGDSVFSGYYKDDLADWNAFRNGWFRTGDMGYMDRRGFLHYTGRKKNLIVLSNGENVSAEALEEKLCRIRGIEEAVVSEQNGKITAEIYADPSCLPDREAVWSEVTKLNRSLASFQRIGDIILRDRAFDKTVTQKIKRHAV